MGSLTAYNWILLIAVPTPQFCKLTIGKLICINEHCFISSATPNQAWCFPIQIGYTQLVAVLPVIVAQSLSTLRPVALVISLPVIPSQMEIHSSPS